MTTFVCHFSPGAEIERGLCVVKFLNRPALNFPTVPVKGSYKAYLCRSEQQAQPEDEETRQHCFQEVCNLLRRKSVPIEAYIPAPGFVVGSDGKPYWITPGKIPTGGYKK
jgi:hypothetical protein